MVENNGICRLPDVTLPSILEGLGEPAVIIDEGLRIVAANQAYRNHFAEGNRVCGKHCYEVSHHYTIPCDQLGESCPLAGARASGTCCPALHIHHTAGGEEHEAVTVHPLFDRAGRIRFYLEVLAKQQIASLKSSRDGQMVGRSPAFARMLDLVSRVADASTTVLLLGESGTGKDLVARAVHRLSSRSGGPFVPLDCSGLTETLFESELFGHEKGSFTGAHERKRGLVEAAN
ncbi:MAG: sigma 54-interacting transcriptional regulator, partial [Thermoanaerobaculia bacterium]